MDYEIEISQQHLKEEALDCPVTQEQGLSDLQGKCGLTVTFGWQTRVCRQTEAADARAWQQLQQLGTSMHYQYVISSG